MPIEMNGKSSEALTAFSEKTTQGFTKGVVITLTVTLLPAATPILIGQTSSIFERSSFTIALRRLGTLETFHTRMQWLENLGPPTLVTATGYLVGFSMAQSMASLVEKHRCHTPVIGAVVVVTVIVTGFVLVTLALLAAHPFQKRVLGAQRRRNG